MNLNLSKYLLTSVLLVSGSSLAAPPVQTTRLPNHGLQPRVALTPDQVHLIYMTGDPTHADIQYQHAPLDAKADKPAFSDAIRVNSEPGAAVPMGTVRGPQLAVDAAGIVHVVWNGSDKATPRKQGDMQQDSSPVLYAHSTKDGSFTKQTSVMQASWGLDGGASIAAMGGPAVPAGSSTIAILWHGADATKPAGEENRGLFLALSTDGGSTFAKEQRLAPASDGACACCGLHAFYDSSNHLGVIYRRAFKGMERDESLLIQTGDNNWNRTRLDPWAIPACPMTTCDAFVGKDGVLLAWETKGQVWLGKWNGQLIQKMIAAPAPKGEKPTNRKHPRLAALPTGEVLMVWTQGAAWGQGGSVAWQEFDASLDPIPNTAGHAESLPAWGSAAAFPFKDGFTVVY